MNCMSIAHSSAFGQNQMLFMPTVIIQSYMPTSAEPSKESVLILGPICHRFNPQMPDKRNLLPAATYLRHPAMVLDVYF